MPNPHNADTGQKVEYLTAAEIEQMMRLQHLAKFPEADDPKQKAENAEYFAGENYRIMVAQSVAAIREAGALLTTQQQRDRRTGRALAAGDRVRYVGPDRLEDVLVAGSSQPKHVHRPHGQLGRISDVTHGVMTFCPEMPRATFEAATKTNTLDVSLVQLQTRDWRLFERVVAS